jgi:hypothetical protein
MCCLERYARCMRYAQDGGLTAEARRRRERVRLEAAEKFEQRVPSAAIAAELRVKVFKSAMTVTPGDGLGQRESSPRDTTPAPCRLFAPRRRRAEPPMRTQIVLGLAIPCRGG